MTQGAKNLKQLQNVSSELLHFTVLLAATVGQVACSARRCGVARQPVGSTVAAQTGLLAAWRLENTTSSHPQQSRLESTVSYLSSIDLLIAIIIFEALQLLSVEKSINHLEVSYLELKCRISFLYFYRNHNQQKFDAFHTFVYCHVYTIGILFNCSKFNVKLFCSAEKLQTAAATKMFSL